MLQWKKKICFEHLLKCYTAYYTLLCCERMYIASVRACNSNAMQIGCSSIMWTDFSIPYAAHILSSYQKMCIWCARLPNKNNNIYISIIIYCTCYCTHARTHIPMMTSARTQQLRVKLVILLFVGISISFPYQILWFPSQMLMRMRSDDDTTRRCSFALVYRDEMWGGPSATHSFLMLFNIKCVRVCINK